MILSSGLMLVLVGLGLWDEKDISLRGLEEIKRADVVYAEMYTGIWKGSLENLEKLTGKKIKVLKRKDVEEGSSKIVEEARSKTVCFLVPGDPLAATTHTDLILQARKLGVDVKIIHASSIFTAIAESGLQLYKFGKTVTIPLPEKTGNVMPQSVYDAIKGNLSLGFHTLILLDIDIENRRNVLVSEALQILRKLDSGKILKDKELLVLSKLGSDQCKIMYASYKKLLKERFELPCVIIVPGKLHFVEEEILSSDDR